MTDFYLWMCNLFVLVAYILSIFMMCESIVVYAERRCGDV